MDVCILSKLCRERLLSIMRTLSVWSCSWRTWSSEGTPINLDRVSHKIERLNEDGNNFVGRAKILDTPNGKIAKSLLDEGVRLGVSSRGMGSLKKESTCNVVQDDFMLATAADIVADLRHLTHLWMVSWKERSGFGIMVS